MEIIVSLHHFPKSRLMKHWYLTLTVFLSICLSTQAQTKDTLPSNDQYANLLYSKNDIAQLKKTADSLNLKYLECTANRVYHSYQQTAGMRFGLKISAEKGATLESMLKEGASLEAIRAALPAVVVKDSAHVVIVYNREYNDYNKSYDTILLSGDARKFDRIYDPVSFSTSNTWIYELKKLQTGYLFDAWLLDRPFSSMQLPAAYASMIQYVDCVVDTSTRILLCDEWKQEATNLSMKKLVTYMLLKNPRTKDLRDIPGLLYTDVDYLYQDLKTSARARQLVDDAIKEAIKKRIGDESLEDLAQGRYSADTVLLLKRMRRVFGQCSMDTRPQQHARAIGQLASQTHQWPVFIRSHLDIMNDRFERLSDASYGEAVRGTHLRELELLDIPSLRLLLGSVFRAADVSAGHYTGDIQRLGRAFTESQQAADFEKQVLACIGNNDLDPFNRCLFFMLYTNYCYYHTDEAVIRNKIAALKADAAGYPEYISKAISRLK